MKKLKKVCMLAIVALAFVLAGKSNSNAASEITGLAQTNDTSSSISLKWNAVLGTEKYYVDASLDNSNWVNVDYSYSSAEGYVSGLTSGSSYYVRVRAVDDNDNLLAISNGVEMVTAPYDSNIDAYEKSATTSKITITGTKVSGANYYQLTYNDVVIGSGTSNTVTTSKKLSSGTAYTIYYRACRKSKSGYVAKGSYDGVYSAKTIMTKLNKSSFGISDIWANINSYNFAISTKKAYDGMQIQFQNPKGSVKKTESRDYHYISIDNFINGKFYKYRVRTYVQCGTTRKYSAWSDFKYIGMPKSLSGNAVKTKKGKRYIRVSWGKVKDAKKYIVYISKSEKSGYKKVKTLSAKKTSYTLSKYGKKKLKSGGKYYVKVVAQAKVGKKMVTSGAYRYGYAQFY